MTRVGVFRSPDEAREYKQLLEQLRASGFALLGGQKPAPVFEAPREIIYYNSSGAAAPPFAALQVINCEIENNVPVMEVDQAVDSYGRSGAYIFNGPTQIANAARGVGFVGVVIVQGDATTYAFGDRLRVKANSYNVEKHPCGQLLCLGKYAIRSETDVYYAIDVGFPSTVDFVAPGGGIAAATGTTTLTMGSASCDIWDDAGTAGQISDSGSDETICNIFDKAVPAGARGKASLNGNGLWVCQEIPITDLRLNGDDYQYWRGGQWTTWLSGSDCPDPP